jgi:hypothetical protein
VKDNSKQLLPVRGITDTSSTVFKIGDTLENVVSQKVERIKRYSWREERIKGYFEQEDKDTRSIRCEKESRELFIFQALIGFYFKAARPSDGIGKQGCSHQNYMKTKRQATVIV